MIRYECSRSKCDRLLSVHCEISKLYIQIETSKRGQRWTIRRTLSIINTYKLSNDNWNLLSFFSHLLSFHFATKGNCKSLDPLCLLVFIFCLFLQTIKVVRSLKLQVQVSKMKFYPYFLFVNLDVSWHSRHSVWEPRQLSRVRFCMNFTSFLVTLDPRWLYDVGT